LRVATANMMDVNQEEDENMKTRRQS
jgi:hypothetical protein